MSYGVTAKEFSDALVRLASAPLCKHYETFQNNIIDIKNPSIGMIAYAKDTECTYAYDGEKWTNLDTGEKYEKQKQKPVRKSTKCQFCGAPLPISKTKNGICKCEWCRSENIVNYRCEVDMNDVTCLKDTEKKYIIESVGVEDDNFRG